MHFNFEVKMFPLSLYKDLLKEINIPVVLKWPWPSSPLNSCHVLAIVEFVLETEYL